MIVETLKERLLSLPIPGIGAAAQVLNASLLQVIVMGLNFLSSLLILRILDKSQYTLYTIFYSLLGALQLMSNSNLITGVQTIGGRVLPDNRKFSLLLLTANKLRRILGAITVPGVIVYAIVLLSQQGFFAAHPIAGYGTFLVLLLLAALPEFLGLFFSTGLLLIGKYQAYYVAQIIQGGIKLVSAALLFYFISAAGYTLYVLLGCIVLANWAWYRYTARATGSFYDPTGLDPDLEMRRELIYYPKVTWHNTLFYVFQGQIGILLLAVVGTQAGVAEFGALGRFAVINTLFLSVASALLYPTYSKVKSYPILKRRLLFALVASVLVGGTLTTLSALFPRLFLWLLGEQYYNLQTELVLAIMMGSVNLINGLVHGLNNARGWIRYSPKFGIASFLVPMLVGALFFDVSTVAGVLKLYILVEIAGLLLVLFNSRHGLQVFATTPTEHES